ncbi:hypothetical protein C5167_006921 [Papaver somniferum]|uniref:Uncharacterized protein n=1 Tax=Papaver somniferum TaxID=3469 RepID=A0A4Y7JGG1_PAPSO|nr:hypothetical protein C5167_006921 [Papaver somniferum]
MEKKNDNINAKNSKGNGATPQQFHGTKRIRASNDLSVIAEQLAKKRKKTSKKKKSLARTTRGAKFSRSTMEKKNDNTDTIDDAE